MFQLVIVKTITLIPQASAANGIYRISDADKVLEEFRGHVFVNRIRLR